MRKNSLAVIMPVYNEEAVIRSVVEKWLAVLDALQIDYNVIVYNDGSSDNTAAVVSELAEKNTRLLLRNKSNSGHGPTILQGYKENCNAYRWLFQTDSDDEMPAEGFIGLWQQRERYDFLSCKRDARQQPLSRKAVSFFSRLTVRLLYGKSVWDVNSPFRLMRSECFSSLFARIPPDTFAPNVLIAGYVGLKHLPFLELGAAHNTRSTGEVSLKKWKLFISSLRSFWQTICFRLRISYDG